MRVAKHAIYLLVPVILCVIGLVFWHQELSVLPLYDNVMTTSQSGKPSKVLVKRANDYEYLGYSTISYARSGALSLNERGSVLVVSSIANENSFGDSRSFADFYQVIETLDYPKSAVSLGFYCGSHTLFQRVEKFFDNFTNEQKDVFPFAKVTIIYAPFLQTQFKSSEHNPSVQRVRRRSIAQGRNFALLNSLDSEQYTLFLDADIIRFDNTGMLRLFVDSDKDIIVPRIEQGPSRDYDRNSWRGTRKTPSDQQLSLMNEGKWDEAAFLPGDGEGEAFHLGDHLRSIQELPDDDQRRAPHYTVELDSVGGAVLFAKSIIYKQGVNFPTLNIVGTDWEREEGFDGIETEGMCYMARTLGYRCHGMPNLVAQHYVPDKTD